MKLLITTLLLLTPLMALPASLWSTPLECTIKFKDSSLVAKVRIEQDLTLDYRLYKGKSIVGSCFYAPINYRNSPLSKIPHQQVNFWKKNCDITSTKVWKQAEVNNKGAVMIKQFGKRHSILLNIFRSLDPQQCTPEKFNPDALKVAGIKLNRKK